MTALHLSEDRWGARQRLLCVSMGAVCCKPKDDPKEQKDLNDRSCTDIICLAFFVLICGGIGGMGIWALGNGNIDGSEPLARSRRPVPLRIIHPLAIARDSRLPNRLQRKLLRQVGHLS